MRRLLALAVVIAALSMTAIPPSSGATSSFTGSVAVGSAPFKSHNFSVTRTGMISVSLSWNVPTADLNLFLYNPDGNLVASSKSTTARPESVSWNARKTGTWKVGVRAARGSASYTVTAQHSTTSSSSSSSSSTTATTFDPPPPPGDHPNVVLILTDDQRWDTTSVMPAVQSLLVARGVEFTNGFVVNSLCCPSRATILEGAYSHSTGVYQNGGPDGPFGGKFSDTSTVATWLDDAGYRTALIGKYFNFYNEHAAQVPPGWDRWVAFAVDDLGGGSYFDYDLSVDGSRRHYGNDVADYSTDVLADEADRFIRGTSPDVPLFLQFAPYGPHLPSTPAPRHANALPGLTPHRPPNYNEADVSDKSAYVRNLPPLTAGAAGGIDQVRQNQLRTLLSVDDAVDKILDALEDTGRLADTMIVFASDNGYAWGEHRWGVTGAQNKQVPYQESIRIPFVVRYDRMIPAARADDRFALTIDIAPTFAQLAGVDAPGSEGRSLLPLLSGAPTAWREDFLVEHGQTYVPSYCAVRDRDHTYTQYQGGEEELYDLVADPYELRNRANDPEHASTLTRLRSRAHTLCTPPPPGFSFVR
jgi:arylsulfatase A-like enzyme